MPNIEMFMDSMENTIKKCTLREVWVINTCEIGVPSI